MAHYSTAQLARKWVHTTDNVTWAIVNEGRWSGNPCLRRTSTGPDLLTGYVSWAPLMTQGGVWSPQRGGVCGFAFKTLALARHQGGAPEATTGNTFIEVFEGSARHFALSLQPDGTLQVYTQATGACTLRATSAGVLLDNEWMFVEMRWYIDASAGICRVRVNGLEVLTYTGPLISTSIGASYTNLWSSVRLLQMRSTTPLLQCWMNDFYLCDLQGSGDQLRDFLGDVQVHLLLPNGVGASTQWTPNTGANWAAADDVPADDDTTYVSTSTAGHRDAYTYTDLPAGATPLGFQTCLLARKETSGTASVSPMMRSGGTNADATAQGVPSTTEYQYLLQPYDTNPVTSARATAAEINAAEFGALRTA